MTANQAVPTNSQRATGATKHRMPQLAMRANHRIVTNTDIGMNDGVRADGDIGAQLSLRMNDGAGMNRQQASFTLGTLLDQPGYPSAFILAKDVQRASFAGRVQRHGRAQHFVVRLRQRMQGVCWGVLAVGQAKIRMHRASP